MVPLPLMKEAGCKAEPAEYIPTGSSKIWIMSTVETDFIELSSSFSKGDEDTFCVSYLGYFRGGVWSKTGRQGPRN